jgi:signal transduction histidine kinase/DNA-binding response OmpR family regulator
MGEKTPTESQPHNDVVDSNRNELGRLLGIAHDRGQGDVFTGKRCWPRTYWGMRLEITTAGAEASDLRHVTMHDISGGGCGFWSKDKIAAGTKLLIREWSSEACTLGIAGYRIGAAFDDPLPMDSPCAVSEVAAPPSTIVRPRSPSLTPPRRSIRAKSARVSAICSVFAALAAIFICTRIWPDVHWGLLSLATAALALLISVLATWLSLRADIRFLNSLPAQIQTLADEPRPSEPPLAPPSQELNQIQHALSSVQVRWLESLERERESRHKLEELAVLRTHILNMVSHDLRTPLTSILLYARMLEDGLLTLAIEDERKFIRIIADECERLSHLVDDLLEAQRLESNRVQWNIQLQDLSKTVRACGLVFEAMAKSKSIEFMVNCPDRLPPVAGDTDKIAQVLSNLVSNALKYTQNGGKVRLSAEPDGSGILISVSDTGPGIPSDQWDQIFDRFSQVPTSYMREIAGVGLGLYIVRQIVDRHDGRVWVESEVGRGSTFYVTLPGKVRPQTAPPPEDSTPSAGHVLVCDPDPELASQVWQILHRANFDVRVAHTGTRLLAMLREGTVDAVVSDVLLPDIDAADLLETVHDGGRRKYGFVVHSYAGDGHEFRRRGADLFVARPGSKQELVQAVRVAMGRHHRPSLLCLLLCSPQMSQKLQRPFIDGGHMTIRAESITAAIARLRNYPIDLILVSDDVLDADWTGIPALQSHTAPAQPIIVLSTRSNRAQRRQARRLGTEVVLYEPGNETAVACTVLEYAVSERKELDECTTS